MSNWIRFEEQEPKVGNNIIAVGTWYGEINGKGEDSFMCIGEYKGNRVVSVDADTYTTDIIDITHWMPIPRHP